MNQVVPLSLHSSIIRFCLGGSMSLLYLSPDILLLCRSLLNRVCCCFAGAYSSFVVAVLHVPIIFFLVYTCGKSVMAPLSAALDF